MFFELSQFPIEFQQQLLKNETVHIVNNGKIVKNIQFIEPEFEVNDDFAFDMERIQQSIDSGVVEVPHFANSEEFIAWLNR